MIQNFIKKILIIGGPGCGKTTLSNKLSIDLNIPVYHLDSFQFDEDWTPTEKKTRDANILNIVSNEEWIIDGNYFSTLEKRIKEADLIIFLDFPIIIRLFRIILRYFKNIGKERIEIPNCIEKFDLKFLLKSILWDKEKKPLILDFLKDYQKNKEIYIFKKHNELKKWYSKIKL